MQRRRLARIRPAPYALPRGTPALQNPPHLRRLLCSLALSGAVIAGAAGFVMGRSERHRPLENPAHAFAGQQRGTEQLARGPLSELLRDHDRFLSEEDAADPAFWHGVRRLLRAALADEQHPEPELLSRLQRAIRRGAPPADVLRLAPLLEHRLQLASR